MLNAQDSPRSTVLIINDSLYALRAWLASDLQLRIPVFRIRIFPAEKNALPSKLIMAKAERELNDSIQVKRGRGTSTIARSDAYNVDVDVTLIVAGIGVAGGADDAPEATM